MEIGGSHEAGHLGEGGGEAGIGEAELLGGEVLEAVVEVPLEGGTEEGTELFRGEIHFAGVQKHRGVAELRVRRKRRDSLRKQ